MNYVYLERIDIYHNNDKAKSSLVMGKKLLLSSEFKLKNLYNDIVINFLGKCSVESIEENIAKAIVKAFPENVRIKEKISIKIDNKKSEETIEKIEEKVEEIKVETKKEEIEEENKTSRRGRPVRKGRN